MTRIGDETVHGFDHGRKSSIGTSAVQLTTVSYAATKGVQLRAAANNSATIYVGNSDVTADAADGTSGFPLAPGEGLFLPVDDPTKVFAVFDATGQKLFFLIV